MEDAHFALESLNEEDWADTAAFGVLDGHGGREVAYFCEATLPAKISNGARASPGRTLIAAFEGMDELLCTAETQELLHSFTGDTRKDSNAPPLVGADRVGCTAVVCLVQPEYLIVANAGDSRAVLARSGVAVPLSEDHKPNLPAERERIHKAGGFIERQQVGSIVQYRINGNLNLSRSIGDLGYKKNSNLAPSAQMVSSTPDVITVCREENDEFIVIACDGVWEVMSSQEAVDFIAVRLHKHFDHGLPLSSIMEELLDHCLSPDLAETQGLGGDNMTAMVILLQDRAKQLANFGQLISASKWHTETTETTIDDRMLLPSGLCSCSAGSVQLVSRS